MSEDTKQFLIKLLGGGLIVGSIAVGVIRLTSPSTTPITDDIVACTELHMDALRKEARIDPSNWTTVTPENFRAQEMRRCRLAVEGAYR